jgi:tetratricopeptide (TPR) repeat protein
MAGKCHAAGMGWFVLAGVAGALTWWLPQLVLDQRAVSQARRDDEVGCERTLRRLTSWPGRNHPHDWYRLAIVLAEQGCNIEALDALHRTGDVEAGQPMATRIEAMLRFRLTGEVDPALDALGRVAPDPAEGWKTPYYQSEVLLDAGRVAEARASAERAVREAAALGAVGDGHGFDRAMGYAHAARVAAVDGDPETARLFLAGASSDAGPDAPPRVRAYLARAAAVTAACEGRTDDALGLLAAAMADLAGLEGGDLAAEVNETWATVAEQAGRADEARQRATVALEAFRRFGPPQAAARMAALIARVDP